MKEINFLKNNSSAETKEIKNRAGKKKAEETARAGRQGKKRAGSEPNAIKWEKPNILTTNLIKDEIVSFFNWKKKAVFLFNVLFAACLILGLSYWGLIAWESKQKKADQSVVDRIGVISRQIDQEKDYVEKIGVFQKKLAISGELLKEHIYWTNFFDFLEKNTLSEVSYGGFSGDIYGEYDLAATAESYKGITDQIKVMLENDMVAHAAASGGKSSAGGNKTAVSFQLNFTVDPAIFTK